MEYKLLTTIQNEIDAHLLDGMLKSKGVSTRLDSKSTTPKRYSYPDVFGVYVREDQWSVASKIFEEFKPSEVKSSSAGHRWSKIHAWVSVVIGISMMLWGLIDMFFNS